MKTTNELIRYKFCQKSNVSSDIISPHFGGCSKRNDAREHLPQLRGHATIIRNEETYRVLKSNCIFVNSYDALILTKWFIKVYLL